MTAAPPVSPPVPLSRNRDYRLLWGSQALSEFGFHAAVIAFPLLVLALTGSGAASGLVMGTIAAAQMVAGLPAGVLVDRYDRKAIMLGCEAAQAVSAISLVVAVWAGAATVWHMVAVAAVFGASAALFEPAENASLPALVADDHLPTAVAMNTARASMGQLAGTATGGFLFAVGRFVPFLVDAVTHTLSFVALLFVRLPRRERPPAGRARWAVRRWPGCGGCGGSAGSGSPWRARWCSICSSAPSISSSSCSPSPGGCPPGRSV
ncbi:hypothetical protein GCM10017744_095960 [Streptomyces antimycoticus]